MTNKLFSAQFTEKLRNKYIVDYNFAGQKISDADIYQFILSCKESITHVETIDLADNPELTSSGLIALLQFKDWNNVLVNISYDCIAEMSDDFKSFIQEQKNTSFKIHLNILIDNNNIDRIIHHPLFAKPTSIHTKPMLTQYFLGFKIVISPTLTPENYTRIISVLRLNGEIYTQISLDDGYNESQKKDFLKFVKSAIKLNNKTLRFQPPDQQSINEVNKFIENLKIEESGIIHQDDKTIITTNKTAYEQPVKVQGKNIDVGYGLDKTSDAIDIFQAYLLNVYAENIARIHRESLLTLTQFVYKAKQVHIDGQLRVKQCFIEADEVIFSETAVLDYEFLSAEYKSITINGAQLNGDDNGYTIFRGRGLSETAINPGTNINTGIFNITGNLGYYDAKAKFNAGSWRFTGACLLGCNYDNIKTNITNIKDGNFSFTELLKNPEKLIASSAITANLLNITAPVLIQSPLIRLNATGKTTSFIAIDAAILKKGRTTRALLDSTMLLNAPIINSSISVLNFFYENIPTFAESLKSIFSKESFELFSLSNLFSIVSSIIKMILPALGFIFPEVFTVFTLISIIRNSIDISVKIYCLITSMVLKNSDDYKSLDEFNPKKYLGSLKQKDWQNIVLDAMDIAGDAAELAADFMFLKKTLENLYAKLPKITIESLKKMLTDFKFSDLSPANILKIELPKLSLDLMHQLTNLITGRIKDAINFDNLLTLISSNQKNISLVHLDTCSLSFLNNQTLANVLDLSAATATFHNNLREITHTKAVYQCHVDYSHVQLSAKHLYTDEESSMNFNNGSVNVKTVTNNGNIELNNCVTNINNLNQNGRFITEGGSFTCNGTQHNHLNSTTEYHDTHTKHNTLIEESKNQFIDKTPQTITHKDTDGNEVIELNPNRITHTINQYNLSETADRTLENTILLINKCNNDSKTEFKGDNVIVCEELNLSEKTTYSGNAPTIKAKQGNLKGAHITTDGINLDIESMSSNDANDLLAQRNGYENFSPAGLVSINLQGKYTHNVANPIIPAKTVEISADQADINTDITRQDLSFFVHARNGDINFNRYLHCLNVKGYAPNGKINVADLNNGVWSRYQNWQYEIAHPNEARPHTIAASNRIELFARDGISNRGAIQAHDGYIISDKGNIDNFGLMQATPTGNLYVGTLNPGANVINHGALVQVPTLGGRSWRPHMIEGRIIGGSGENNNGIGLVINSEGKVINNASTITATGNAIVRGAQGVSLTSTAHHLLVYDYKGKKEHDQIWNTLVCKSTLGSYNGEVYVDTGDGSFDYQAANLFSKPGSPIHINAKNGVNSIPLPTLSRFTSKQHGFLSHSESETVTTSFEKSNVIGGGLVINSEVPVNIFDTNIPAKHLEIHAPHATLGMRPTQTYSYNRSYSVIPGAASLFGHTGLDDTGFFSELNALSNSVNLDDFVKHAYYLSLTNPEASKEFLSWLTKANHQFNVHTLHPDFKNPNPNFEFQYHSNYGSSYSNRAGNGGIHVETLILDTPESLTFSGAIHITAEKGFVRTKKFNQLGIPIFDINNSRSNNFAINPFNYSASVKLQSNNSFQSSHQNQFFYVDDLTVDIDDWYMRNAITQTNKTSGHIGHLTIITDPTITETDSRSFSLDTKGNMGFNKVSVYDASYNNNSYFYTNNADDLQISTVHNQGSVIYNVPRDHIGEYYSIPVYGEHHSAQFGFSVNPNDLFNKDYIGVGEIVVSSMDTSYELPGLLVSSDTPPDMDTPAEVLHYIVKNTIGTSYQYDLRFPIMDITPKPVDTPQTDAATSTQGDVTAQNDEATFEQNLWQFQSLADEEIIESTSENTVNNSTAFQQHLNQFAALNTENELSPYIQHMEKQLNSHACNKQGQCVSITVELINANPDQSNILEELQNQRFQHQKAILHDFFVDGVKHYFEKLALDAMQKYGFIKNKFERKLLKVIKKTEKLPHKNDDLDNDANYFNVVKKLEYIMLSMMSVPAKAPLFFLKYDELMHKLYDETQLLQQIAQIKEARKNGVLFRNSELKTELLQRSFEYDLITIQNHDLSMQPIKLFDAGLDAANHKITKLPKATVKFFDNHLGVFSSAVDAATFAPPTVQHQRYSLFGASSLTQDSASSESNTNFYHHSK